MLIVGASDVEALGVVAGVDAVVDFASNAQAPRGSGVAHARWRRRSSTQNAGSLAKVRILE